MGGLPWKVDHGLQGLPWGSYTVGVDYGLGGLPRGAYTVGDWPWVGGSALGAQQEKVWLIFPRVLVLWVTGLRALVPG